jgi:hypothetical protein
MNEAKLGTLPRREIFSIVRVFSFVTTRQCPVAAVALASFFQDLHQAACPCMIAAISRC